jgi:hypothetical protein
MKEYKIYKEEKCKWLEISLLEVFTWIQKTINKIKYQPQIIKITAIKFNIFTL